MGENPGWLAGAKYKPRLAAPTGWRLRDDRRQALLSG